VSNNLVAGKVEHTGRALALAEVLTAPLTERACLAYRVIVDEPGLLGRSVVAREDAVAAFALDDGTLVQDIARVEFGVEESFTSGHLAEPDDRLQLFLFMHGQRHEDFVGLNRSLRFREWILAPGDRVRVNARAEWEASPGGSGGSFREPPRRLILRKCAIFIDR
jgi:hypothetical protein